MRFVLYASQPETYLPLVAALHAENHSAIMANPRFFSPRELEYVDAVLVASDVRDDLAQSILAAYEIPCVSPADTLEDIFTVLAKSAPSPDGELVTLGGSVEPKTTETETAGIGEALPEIDENDPGEERESQAQPDIETVIEAMWPRVRARGIKKQELRDRLTADPHEFDVICHEIDADPAVILAAARDKS
jgi:hypothetical protein